MRIELIDLHTRLKTTMIYVTHDQVEAMTLADQIVVMNAGRIEQVGAPMELYSKPATEFVATFIGSPKMNLFKGPPAAAENAATIGIRPEDLTIGDSGAWRGRVRVVEHLGNETIAYVQSDIGDLVVRQPGHRAVKAGETIHMTPQREALHRFGPEGRRI